MIHELVSLPVHPDAPEEYVRVVQSSAGFRWTRLGELPNSPGSNAPPGTVCFEWIGSRNTSGYPHVKVRGVKSPMLAHKLAHIVWNGPVPDGWEVDHLCDNVFCWRPEHLEAITEAEHRLRTQRRTKAKRMPKVLRERKENRDDKEYRVLVLADDRGYGRKKARMRGQAGRTAGREGRQSK